MKNTRFLFLSTNEDGLCTVVTNKIQDTELNMVSKNTLNVGHMPINILEVSAFRKFPFKSSSVVLSFFPNWVLVKNNSSGLNFVDTLHLCAPLCLCSDSYVFRL